MSIFQALLLGAFQGIAEFLPISSSGHLALMKQVMGLAEIPALFDIILHVATLFSILLVFRRRVGGIIGSILRYIAKKNDGRDTENLSIVVPALLATVLTAGIGLAIKKLDFEASPAVVGVCLLLTAALLVASHFFKGKTGFSDLRWRHGLITGFAQGIGVLPGISRSGITISAGLAAGLSREVAGEFSFLLAIPAIIGALVLEIGDIAGLLGSVSVLPLAIGALASFLVGVAALRLLMPIVRRGKLVWFAAYLIPLGLIAILFL